MGTPAFAVPTLKKLINSNYYNNIIAVYTAPPKKAGRGRMMTQTPIHDLAAENNIEVFTPKTFKIDENYEQLKALQPDIIVVVAYGLILPQRVLDIPKYGCFNLHPSLLPRWRGAAPLQHTILSNDKKSAVCIMKMDAGMDTGDIALKHDFNVDNDMTISQLHDYCSDIGAELMLQTLEQIGNNKLTLQKQSDIGITHARKITRSDERLDFNEPVELVHSKIRAFTPRPAAYFKFNGEKIKIIAAEYKAIEHDYAIGTVIDDLLGIACNSGILKPTLLQREGKKMIYTDAFLRGFPIPKNTIMENPE